MNSEDTAKTPAGLAANSSGYHFDSKFGVGNRVFVKDLESFAYVRAVEFTMLGLRYEIHYFHEGEKRSAYVFPDEVRQEK